MAVVIALSRLCCLRLRTEYSSIKYHYNRRCAEIFFRAQNLTLLRYLHNSNVISFARKENATDTVPKTHEPTKEKKEKVTYITLISVDDKQTVTTMEDATKLAKRRNFKLVKISDVDSKTDRATYKLYTVGQFVGVNKSKSKNTVAKESGYKGEKVLNLNSNIAEHDLTSKIKQLCKFITKNFEVRVVISGNISDAEKVYKAIEGSVKDDGRIVQKRQKGTDIRFQILPSKKVKEAESLTNVEELETKQAESTTEEAESMVKEGETAVLSK